MNLSIDHVMQFDHDDLGASNTWHRDNSSKLAYYERLNRDFNVLDSLPDKMSKRRAHARAYYADRITPEWIIIGQGEGMQGQSYAIPTTGGYTLFAQAVRRFVEFAAEHPDKRFLVTRVGCGNARHDLRSVARLFVDAIRIENICLPEKFWEVLGLKLFRK